jgi:hypothetical protein
LQREVPKLLPPQATLGIDAANGERVAVSCKVEEDQVLICSLRDGVQECVNMDLVLSSYSEFSLFSSKKQGSKASIHLAGYLMAESDEEEEEGDDGDCCAHNHAHHHTHEGQNHMCMSS